MGTIIGTAVGLILGLIIMLPFFAVYVVRYILEGIAFSRMTKPKGIKYGWLAWVPSHVEYIAKLLMMLDLSDDPGTKMFCGKLTFKNKKVLWIIFLCLYVGVLLLSFGNWILSLLLGLIIPGVGDIIAVIISVILCLPFTACYVWQYLTEYVCLRDLINTYKPHGDKNVSTAIWVTIGNIPTMGLVRAIYLLRLTKELPAVTEEEDAAEMLIEEPAEEEKTEAPQEQPAEEEKTEVPQEQPAEEESPAVVEG